MTEEQDWEDWHVVDKKDPVKEDSLEDWHFVDKKTLQVSSPHQPSHELATLSVPEQTAENIELESFQEIPSEPLNRDRNDFTLKDDEKCSEIVGKSLGVVQNDLRVAGEKSFVASEVIQSVGIGVMVSIGIKLYQLYQGMPDNIIRVLMYEMFQWIISFIA